jgi:hypothetical protein
MSNRLNESITSAQLMEAVEGGAVRRQEKDNLELR